MRSGCACFQIRNRARRATHSSARSWRETCSYRWNFGRCSTVVKAETIVIREITSNDVEAVARLSGELGYPVSAQQMAGRIHTHLRLADHATYLAVRPDGAVVGWIDIGMAHHLQADPYAEIGGFVVSGEVRSLGIGKKLLARAEAWAAERGVR